MFNNARDCASVHTYFTKQEHLLVILVLVSFAEALIFSFRDFYLFIFLGCCEPSKSKLSFKELDGKDLSIDYVLCP